MGVYHVTVVIVDDHPVVASGVRKWCERADPPIEVIDAGKSLTEVWAGEGASADVVVLDLSLAAPHREFHELRRLTESGRQVIIYTHTEDDKTAIKCIDLGALSFVTKSEAGNHLVAAIHAAAEGRSYTPPTLSGAMASDTSSQRPALAPSEIDALRAWFQSSSKQVAAQMLRIEKSTISTYIERARIKYANVGRPAPTKNTLVLHAIDDGLIDPNELKG